MAVTGRKTMGKLTTTPEAAKGGSKRKQSGIKVVGYVTRNDERIRRDSLPPEEQARLATAWTTKAMQSIGYEPAHRPDPIQTGMGVTQ